jgi:hypothetical protein
MGVRDIVDGVNKDTRSPPETRRACIDLSSPGGVVSKFEVEIAEQELYSSHSGN